MSSFPIDVVSTDAPAVRSLGQKRVHRRRRIAGSIRWTQSFPRTRRRPDARQHDTRGRAGGARTAVGRL